MYHSSPFNLRQRLIGMISIFLFILCFFFTLNALFAQDYQWAKGMLNGHPQGGQIIANAPAALNEISVLSSEQGTFISIATGNWNSPSTWNANAVPTASDMVTISTGHTVTIENLSQSIAQATVNGTLAFASSASSLTVSGDLLVANGGLLQAFNGTTGKVINVAGNLTNNGTIDLSKNSAQLVLNGASAQTVDGTGTFTSGYIRVLTFNNSAAVPTINWKINVNVYGTLTFTKGWVNLESSTMILGFDAANLGSLSYSSGGFTSGTFGRWMSATSTGTAITAGSNPTSSTSRFPFITPTGTGRSAWIERILPSAAGIHAFTYNHASTNSVVDITDGAYTINKRYDGNWTFSTLGTTPVATSYEIAFVAQGAFVPLNGNTRIMLASAPAGGNHQNGTNTPGIQRAGMSMANLTAGPFYIGIGAADEVYTSAASGEWNNPATWSNGSVPPSTAAATIAANHNVTISSGSASIAAVTTIANSNLIVNGGALSITGETATGITNAGSVIVSGGSLTIGADGFNNRRFTNSSGGTLEVSDGNFTVYGNIAIGNGSNFTQSGGVITVDGNNGGSTANSVPTGTPIFAIGTTSVQRSSGTVSLTGGTLTIVDPHAGSGTNDFAFYYNGSIGTSYNIVAAASHTLQFGNGVSMDAGGNAAYQFGFNFWAGESAFTPGNIIVDALTGINRVVRSRITPYVIGNNVIINSGEFQDISTAIVPDNRMYLGGDLEVNAGGILTTGEAVSFSTATYDANVGRTITPAAVPTTRSISGSGIIRNSASGPTANFTNLFINNTDGVTSSRSLSVSDQLGINTPVFNFGSETVTLGTSPSSPGTYIQESGYIQGRFKRWISTAVGVRAFYLGVASGVKTAVIDFTTAPATGGSLTAEWIAGDGGTSGLPLTEGAITVSNISAAGFWRVTAGDGLNGGTYTSTFTPGNLTGITDYTQLVLLKRTDGLSPWTFNGTHTTTTGTNAAPVLSRSGMSGFSEFGIGSSVNVLPVTLMSFFAFKTGDIHRIQWRTSSEQNNSGFEVQRSADGKNFTALTFAPSKAIEGYSVLELDYSVDDVAPLKGNCYYRLKQIDKDGRSIFSRIFYLKGTEPDELVISNIYPVPAINDLKVVITLPSAENLQLAITDINGKTLHTRSVNVISGENLLNVDVTHLQRGTYFVIIIRNGNNNKTYHKFIKQ